ncbi:DeoR/GlpR transcriptional regulator [Lacticaseibacillus casei]|uniref:DeoR/GlpR family DNA-binding transcription regulator n=1 Tax=Lacticaseibacillus casei TaxID=1582 RepID=UPI001108B175|nr:DeoR/GlpR family DNA-binding transcription regulator [Lacticaseibacillus casei]TLQ51380.1 DeoR/GlpR transcriptional regulator [Lacticaseibacillus casei]
MYSEERQHVIRQIIKSEGKVSVNKLSDKLKVSEVTIRRDLADMEEQGLLKRTFGGAVSVELVTKAQPYNIKKGQHLEEKQAISKRAAQFLTDGMTVFVDAGTTTNFLVPFISKKRDLTVVTVDLQIALQLSDTPSTDIYVVGGRLSNSSKSVNSVDSVLTVKGFHFDLSFIGCDAFNLSTFETDSETKAQIKKAAIDSSSLRTVLSDSSKFNKHSLRNFATLDDLDYVVTDSGIAEFPSFLKKEEKSKFIIGGF